MLPSGDDPKSPPTVAELAAQIDELQARVMYLTEKLDRVLRAFARIGGIASGLKEDKCNCYAADKDFEITAAGVKICSECRKRR